MKIKNKRILLTGGAGFIGSRLAELLHSDNEVVIYDSFVRDSLRHKKINLSKLKITEGDILDYSRLKKTCEDFRPQIALHLAAVAGVDTVIRNPVRTMEVNVLGTFNFVKALGKYAGDLERVVNFSTSEVLGSYAYKSTEKTSTNLSPVGEGRWTYSISKVTGEHLLFSFFKERGYPAVSIRPFNIYGPGQIGEGAIHIFIKNAILNRDIEIHGDGDQIRSWCYIDDMIEGTMLCLKNPKAVGEIFNIGNPKGTVTITSLAEKITALCKTKSRIKYIPKNYVDVELRIPSIDKARDILGFIPKTGLNEGIKKTFEWYSKVMKK